MEHQTLLLILACCFGFFMAWGVGANDVANAMGTSVGSRALTIKQAIIIAAIFESAGALLAGGEVTDTIRGKIIDPSTFQDSPNVLVYGMLAALLASGTWLITATYFGWPVSTTHSIVGAIIGFGVIQVGTHAIYWDKVTDIVLSWILTPFIAGTIAYLIFRSIQKLILLSDSPVANAKRYVPWYVFFVSFVLSMVTFVQGLRHLGLHFSFTMNILFSLGVSIICLLLAFVLMHNIHRHPKFQLNVNAINRHHEEFKQVERVFGLLMIFTACSMAFAHGSNDVANAIGPLAAIIGILSSASADVMQSTPLPPWILLLGAAGIVAGLAMYGYKVIRTIGNHITDLTPSRGFSAEVAAASTVVLASGTGLPISTTQTLVGAILGVGLARGISALKLNVIGSIFMSWIITLPAGALLAIIYYHLLAMVLT